ncbi:MAG: DUF4250 domain-containing protein [Bacilli bacterium]|nr:DUF4250 domain-containing protein [Bacilli bacterium]
MTENPVILLSIINTKLRDQYNSIEELCDDLDYDLEKVNQILNNAGYCYNRELNQYK